MSDLQETVEEFIERTVDECIEVLHERFDIAPLFYRWLKLLMKRCCMQSVNFTLRQDVEHLRSEMERINRGG